MHLPCLREFKLRLLALFTLTLILLFLVLFVGFLIFVALLDRIEDVFGHEFVRVVEDVDHEEDVEHDLDGSLRDQEPRHTAHREILLSGTLLDFAFIEIFFVLLFDRFGLLCGKFVNDREPDEVEDTIARDKDSKPPCSCHPAGVVIVKLDHSLEVVRLVDFVHVVDSSGCRSERDEPEDVDDDE